MPADTPRACPNLGVDCIFPHCTADPECAAANVSNEDDVERAHLEADHGASALTRPVERTLSPITADDIFGKK